MCFCFSCTSEYDILTASEHSFRILFLCKVFFKILNFVQVLPWKIHICTSEMSVSCSLFVDRSSQVKHLDDSGRTKVEVLTDDLNKFCIRKSACSECIYVNRCRMSNTDCIGKLDLALVSKSCCYDILCYITSCICCGTVNLVQSFPEKAPPP